MNEDNRTRDARNDARLNGEMMDEETVADSVLGYLNDNPELVRDLAPERDLWPGIESRITAGVLQLDTTHMRVAPMRATHDRDQRSTLQQKLQWKSWLPMAAAAAVLMAGSASLTYVLTGRGDVAVQPSSTTGAVAAAPAVPATSTQSSLQPQDSEGQQAAQPVAIQPRDVAAASARAHGDTHHPITTDGARSGGIAPSSTRFASHDDAAADPRATYDAEITTLRSALDARRSQLDPATVRTIEQNLTIIDNAIAQARAALAKDPRSRFLGSQLDRSLAKETDLLRAAALLPST